jgi:hypothetical protein
MDSDEYERRKQFCLEVAAMNRSECVEIARILRSHGVTVSENRSGIFFDMAKLPMAVFEELIKFREFIAQNNTFLERQPKASTQLLTE